MDAFKMAFTVWRFLSPSTGEAAIVARHSEPRDDEYQHEYQRIVWSGMAYNKKEALELARAAL